MNLKNSGYKVRINNLTLAAAITATILITTILGFIGWCIEKICRKKAELPSLPSVSLSALQAEERKREATDVYVNSFIDY